MKRITDIKWHSFSNSPDEVKKLSQSEKDRIIEYLNGGFVYLAGDSSLNDPVSGDLFEKTSAWMSDDDEEYEWSNAEIYMFEKYDMKLRDDFVRKVLS